jgi:hypothetical protein
MTKLTDSVYPVEVPEGATNFRIMKFSQPETFSYDYSIQKGDRCTTGLIAMVDLPPGNWRILCTTREATEEIAASIVQIVSNGKISGMPQYRRYDRDLTKDMPARCWTRDSRHSLETLITSKGLDINKNYVLLEKG